MAKKSKIYFSNGVWTKISNSWDSHGTFLQAKGACVRLIQDYGETPCNLRGNCVRACVTDEEGYVLFEICRDQE
jgi:hypothetical protein